ncbi:hypothetical protein RB598_009541 [Gaeumannomyces tritici]
MSTGTGQPAPPAVAGVQQVPLNRPASPAFPFGTPFFDPDLDDKNDVRDAFEDIETGHLATTTCLYLLRAPQDGEGLQETTLNDADTVGLFSIRGKDKEFRGVELCAVSRVDTSRDPQSPQVPGDRARLRISKRAFRSVMSAYEMPVAFAVALSRHYMVSGTGFRVRSADVWDYWCVLPVRVFMGCSRQAQDHTRSTAGSNQMDPFHYIHLSGVKADIRGSHIGLFVQHNTKTKSTSALVINLLDGRLSHAIEEPLARVRDAIIQQASSCRGANPRFVLFIYLSSSLRWWDNVLSCFNQQLVMHEKQLQSEIGYHTPAFSDRSKDINASLHIMAAHLHRYKTELDRTELILQDVLSSRFGTRLTTSDADTDDSSVAADVMKGERLKSQLRVILSFTDEMEKKIQNILNLLFNQIQVANDSTLQAILRAAQADNKLSQRMAFQSHELTISMKNDSIAMKTIAILTMIFLPATSFAAILSMPFFNQTEYMMVPSHSWIWGILTLVFTPVAFGVFFRITQTRENTNLDTADGGGSSNGSAEEQGTPQGGAGQ